MYVALATMMMTAAKLYGQDTANKAGGTLTPDIEWNIDEGGILRISGTGTVPTTMFGQKSAWHNHRSDFQSVEIGEGIINLGKMVFFGYRNITSLTVAGSVRELAPQSFQSCKNLRTVELKGTTPPDISVSTFYGLKYKNVKLIIPAGTRAIYEADPIWSQFGTIEESVQTTYMQATQAETLSEPCIVFLTRSVNFVGGGRAVNVFLNGVEQGKLENGKAIRMQTSLDKNVLYIKQGKTAVAVLRFEATAGGEIDVNYSYFLGYMKIGEDEE